MVGTQRDRWFQWIAYALILVASLTALLTFDEYGVTWDEEANQIYGEYILRWYGALLTGGEVEEMNAIMKFYGGFFDVVAQVATRLSPSTPFEIRHLVNAAFGLLAVWGVRRVATNIGGSLAGLIAVVFLLTTPTFYGHMFNNPKDVPFAAMFTLALGRLLDEYDGLGRRRLRSAALTGVLVGLAMAVRIAGIALLGLLAVLWMWRRSLSAAPEEEPGARIPLRGLLVRAFIVVSTAWATMMLWWPLAFSSPLAGPVATLLLASHFPWPLDVFFDGRYYPASDVPRSYTLMWFAITLPEHVLLGGVVAFVMAVALLCREPGGWRRSAAAPKLVVVGLPIIVPVLLAVALRPILYDGVRHFMFVIPCLVVVGAVALARLFQEGGRRWVQVAVLAATVASVGVTVRDMVLLHPYQSVYFNHVIAGGLPRAATRFETDYWGSSHREGVLWLAGAYDWRAAKEPVRVANCSTPFLTGYYLASDAELRRAFTSVTLDDDPHIVLTTTRFDCHRKQPGRVLHVVERMGTPLLYVFEVRPPLGVASEHKAAASPDP